MEDDRERESQQKNINEFSIQSKQIEMNEVRWAIKQSIFSSSIHVTIRKIVACSAKHVVLQCILPVFMCVNSLKYADCEFVS